MKPQCLILALWLLAACADRPEGRLDEPARALRYRVLVHESALDAMHGFGTWVDELYFPEQGVVCNLVWHFDLSGIPIGGTHTFTGDEVPVPEMNAFFGSLKERLEPTGADPAARTEPVEIEVPADLAREIFRLAALTAEQRRLAASLGPLAVQAGILGGFDTVKEQ